MVESMRLVLGVLLLLMILVLYEPTPYRSYGSMVYILQDLYHQQYGAYCNDELQTVKMHF